MQERFSVLHLLWGNWRRCHEHHRAHRATPALGISSYAVCDAMGTPEERARLQEAVGGKARFTPLYWWNRKIRSAL